jgi:hypothetical protein
LFRRETEEHATRRPADIRRQVFDTFLQGVFEGGLFLSRNMPREDVCLRGVSALRFPDFYATERTGGAVFEGLKRAKLMNSGGFLGFLLSLFGPFRHPLYSMYRDVAKTKNRPYMAALACRPAPTHTPKKKVRKFNNNDRPTVFFGAGFFLRLSLTYGATRVQPARVSHPSRC